MDVNHFVTLYLTAPTATVVEAVQGDGVRVIAARLMEGAEPWPVPEGVTAGIGYELPGKVSSYYDQLRDGTPACMIAGNLVTAAIDGSLTAAAGNVKLSIVLRDSDGGQVATFPVTMRVAKRPGRIGAEEMPPVSAYEGKLLMGGRAGTTIPVEIGDGLSLQRDGNKAVLTAPGGGSEWEAMTVTDVVGRLLSPKGGLLSGSEDKLVSEPISIRSGDALRVTGSAKYGNSLWAIYNSAGEMIANQVAPATAAGLTVAEQEIEAPSGAASIRVAWDKTISDTPYAVSRKAAEQTAAALPLDGQTLVVLGDSIVQGQGVANDLCTRLAAATGANVVNLGVGGTGWMHRQEEGNAYYQRVADIPEDAAIVILSGGGNDRNDPLGTADSTGTDTVAGCIHAALDAVRARVPAARVCVAAPTPWQYYPPHNRGNDIAKLVDVMAEICRRRGIPFLDLYHTSGLAPWDDTIRELLFVDGDGVHPNDLGYGVFAPQFVQLALGGSHNPVDVQEIAERAAGMVNVPGGGGGSWVKVGELELTEDVTSATVNLDRGVSEAILCQMTIRAAAANTGNGSLSIYFNNTHQTSYENEAYIVSNGVYVGTDVGAYLYREYREGWHTPVCYGVRYGDTLFRLYQRKNFAANLTINSVTIHSVDQEKSLGIGTKLTIYSKE